MARGELNVGEPHPAALTAKAYIATQGWETLAMWQEAFASCAIEGNRLGEICSETLARLIKGQAVSDRYVLGLAWTIKTMEERDGFKHPGSASRRVGGEESPSERSAD